MGKLNWLILLTLVSVLVGGYLYRKRVGDPVPAYEQPSRVSEAGSAALEDREENLVPSQEVGETTRSVRELAPSLSEYREEAKKNPHRTPPSLVRFATGLAPKMERALKSREEAARLTSEFRQCVQTPEIAPPAQAVCLRNAQRLAQKHPQLESSYRAVREAASPQATEINARTAKLSSKD